MRHARLVFREGQGAPCERRSNQVWGAEAPTKINSRSSLNRAMKILKPEAAAVKM
jgi:hypothetical protein